MGGRHCAPQLRHGRRCSRSPGRAPCLACHARLIPLIVAVGVFDTGANALVAFATTQGSTGIVAVLSALYPVMTILLARAVLRERLGPTARPAG